VDESIVPIYSKIKSKICAGIILYNPELSRLSDSIKSILPQVTELIIVDNNSVNIQVVIQEWPESDVIHYILNDTNYGIARALNQICIWANDKSYDWILTLDQDSICEQELIQKYSIHVQDDAIGIVCPRIAYENITEKKKTVPEIDYIDACMTSASLTNIKAWDIVGGFDEWMFIDYVDNDFCMRLKLSGYKVLRVNNTRLNHMLGNSKEISIFNLFKIHTSNHNPLRNYYFVRNNVYYIRKYRHNVSLTKEFSKLIYIEFRKIVFEKQRIKNIKTMIKGLIEGFRKNI